LNLDGVLKMMQIVLNHPQLQRQNQHHLSRCGARVVHGKGCQSKTSLAESYESKSSPESYLFFLDFEATALRITTKKFKLCRFNELQSSQSRLF
jgi:hypothetical protein